MFLPTLEVLGQPGSLVKTPFLLPLRSPEEEKLLPTDQAQHAQRWRGSGWTREGSREPPVVPPATAHPDSVLGARPLGCLLLGISNLTQWNRLSPRARSSQSQTPRPPMQSFSLPCSGHESFHPVLCSVSKIYLESIHCQHFGSALTSCIY